MSLNDVTTLPNQDEFANETAVEQEQSTLDEAFARRDELLRQLDADLAIPAADAVQHTRMRMMAAQRSDLTHAEQGLIFGRLDALDETVRHLGRVGIPGQDGEDSEPLVIDWRAPAARLLHCDGGRPSGSGEASTHTHRWTHGPGRRR